MDSDLSINLSLFVRLVRFGTNLNLCHTSGVATAITLLNFTDHREIVGK